MPLNLNPNSKKKERKTEERKNRMGFLIDNKCNGQLQRDWRYGMGCGV